MSSSEEGDLSKEIAECEKKLCELLNQHFHNTGGEVKDVKSIGELLDDMRLTRFGKQETIRQKEMDHRMALERLERVDKQYPVLLVSQGSRCAN